MDAQNVVPQWRSTNTDNVWFDPDPWIDRATLLEAAANFRTLQNGIHLVGFWRVKPAPARAMKEG